MEQPRVRVRVGGAAGGGLLSTSQIDVALVGVGQNDSHHLPQFTKEFVYMHVPGVDVASLTSSSFIAKNCFSRSTLGKKLFRNSQVLGDTSYQEAPNPFSPPSAWSRKRPRAPISTSGCSSLKSIEQHALVAVARDAALSRSNALALTPKGKSSPLIYALRVSVDRATFHQLGLQASARTSCAGSAGRRMPWSDRGSRMAIDVSIPRGKREKWALGSDRVGLVDVIMSRGTIPPVPPKSCEGVAELRHIRPIEIFRQIPRLLSADANIVPRLSVASEHANDGVRAVFVDQEDEDFALLQALDSAQRILTGIGLTPSTSGEEPSKPSSENNVPAIVRSYVGLSNSDLEKCIVEYCKSVVMQGFAEFAIVGAVGSASAPHLWENGGGRDRGDTWTGFGGDAGVVTIIGQGGESVSFELRAPCDL